MDRARQREIAAKGGKAAHAKGTAHVWSPEEAREAGRKGGVAVSRDRSHMSAIGREGGESRSAMVRAARRRSEQDVLNEAAASTLEREVPLTHGQLRRPLPDQVGDQAAVNGNGRRTPGVSGAPERSLQQAADRA